MSDHIDREAKDSASEVTQMMKKESLRFQS